MNSALGAKKLQEHLDYVFAECLNVGEIWARFQRGGAFKNTHVLVIINNSIHLEGRRGLHAQKGVIGD